MKQQRLEQLADGIFAIVMTLLVFEIKLPPELTSLSTDPEIAKSFSSIEKEKISLQDIHHHFLPFGAPSKYHHAFKWLSLLLDRYPHFESSHVHKAVRMIKLIYEAFGYHLDEEFKK